MMLYGYLLVSQLMVAANLLCVLVAKGPLRSASETSRERNEDDE